MLINPQNVGLFAFGIAFSAGLISFLSPCVLPLVPAYIGYLSGATMAGGQIVADTRRTFSHAVAFVLGFLALFVVLGASLGLAELLLGQFAGGGGAGAAFDLQQIATDLLTRVGVVLLVVMAVRVADTTLDGDWRIRIGDTVVLWPSRVAGVPQKYIRWGLVGLAVALLFAWLYGAKTPAERLLLALMIGILPLAGVGLSARGALVLGILVAILNSAAWAVSPLAGLYTAADWAGFALQAALIVLVVYYVSRTQLFYMERHLEVSDRLQNRGYLTSGLMGAVFGAGWTPCTGPNLAIILAMAAAAGSVAIGTALLSTYALGLGIPFLLVGLFFGYATRTLRRLMPYMNWIKAVNTALLLLIAVLILSDSLQLLAGYGGFFKSFNL